MLFIPESVSVVPCDVRWLCMILSEDIVRKFLNGKLFSITSSSFTGVELCILVSFFL